jgi:very-short-patch-repair endonuclease
MRPKCPLIARAKELRTNATDAERFLWRHLRQSQLAGIKFRRQHPIAGYICDLVSFTPKLVAESREHDAKRDACLIMNGFSVLRFWNNDVLTNIDGVLAMIRQHIETSTPTP